MNFTLALKHTVYCFTIQIITSFIMSSNPTYQTFNKLTKFRFDNRVVSMIYNILLPICSIISIYNNKIQSYDSMNELSPMAIYTIYMATGYFLWDIFVSFVDVHLTFKIHALFCFLVYTLFSMYSQWTMYGCAFLLYEISSPLIHVRWFIRKLKYNMSTDMLELFIFSLFTTTRILLGLPGQYLLGKQMIQNYNDSIIQNSILLLINGILMGLNIYWFTLMFKRCLTVVDIEYITQRFQIF